MQGIGYPKKFIEKAVRDQLKKASVPRQSSEDEETNKEEWQAARIPFIEGVSYEVRRIAGEAGKPAMNRDKGVEKSRTWNGLFT